MQPEAYPIPTDGPVGSMLAATSRSPMRPAHVHFKVTAPGYQTLITHVFDESDQYLDTDAVFGVRSSLLATFEHHDAGTAPDGREMTEPWRSAQFDLILAPEASRGLARAPLPRPAAGHRGKRARTPDVRLSCPGVAGRPQVRTAPRRTTVSRAGSPSPTSAASSRPGATRRSPRATSPARCSSTRRASPASDSESMRKGCRIEHERVVASRVEGADERIGGLARRGDVRPIAPRRAPVGEGLESVVGVDRRPAEGQAGDGAGAPRALARGRAPAQTVRGQGLERPRPESAAGRTEALDLEAEARERADAAPEELVLLGRRERVPDLVAPAVQPDLVPGRGDGAQGLGIELGVQALDEERRAQVERGQGLQRAWQPDGDRRVVADRRAARSRARGRPPPRGCRS